MRLYRLKQFFVGSPLATAPQRYERLSKSTALAVFAAATEEVLFDLILAGAAALSDSLPIAVGISILIAIVVMSYRQTIAIAAYPQAAATTSSRRTTSACGSASSASRSSRSRICADCANPEACSEGVAKAVYVETGPERTRRLEEKRDDIPPRALTYHPGQCSRR